MAFGVQEKVETKENLIIPADESSRCSQVHRVAETQPHHGSCSLSRGEEVALLVLKLHRRAFPGSLGPGCLRSILAVAREPNGSLMHAVYGGHSSHFKDKAHGPHDIWGP